MRGVGDRLRAMGADGHGLSDAEARRTNRFDPKSDLRSTFDRFQPETIAANKPFVDRITEFARTKGATTPQLSLAWLLAQKPFIVPIPGTGKVKHLQENIESTKLVLTADDLKEMDTRLFTLRTTLTYPNGRARVGARSLGHHLMTAGSIGLSG